MLFKTRKEQGPWSWIGRERTLQCSFANPHIPQIGKNKLTLGAPYSLNRINPKGKSTRGRFKILKKIKMSKCNVNFNILFYFLFVFSVKMERQFPSSHCSTLGLFQMGHWVLDLPSKSTVFAGLPWHTCTSSKELYSVPNGQWTTAEASQSCTMMYRFRLMYLELHGLRLYVGNQRGICTTANTYVNTFQAESGVEKSQQ